MGEATHVPFRLPAWGPRSDRRSNYPDGISYACSDATHGASVTSILPLPRRVGGFLAVAPGAAGTPAFHRQDLANDSGVSMLLVRQEAHRSNRHA